MKYPKFEGSVPFQDWFQAGNECLGGTVAAPAPYGIVRTNNQIICRALFDRIFKPLPLHLSLYYRWIICQVLILEYVFLGRTPPCCRKYWVKDFA